MLVLSRKKNESLVLGPNSSELVQITVIEVRGDKVRLGIEVPRHWLLHRKEIYEALQRPEPPDPPKDPE